MGLHWTTDRPKKIGSGTRKSFGDQIFKPAQNLYSTSATQLKLQRAKHRFESQSLSLIFVFAVFSGDNSTDQASTVMNSSVGMGNAVTPRDLRRSRRSRPRARHTSSPPPSVTVQSLMEMGFPRKAVEQAAKALGGIGDITPSPESIVGWLLEHQALVIWVYETLFLCH